MKDDLVYVHHILDAIARIESYVKNMTFKKFVRSHMAQDAVIRQVAIIGEASRHFSPEFLSAHAYIPWSKIAGTRNILIHDYVGVEMSEVWRITQEDLPELKKQMKQILRDDRTKTNEGK
jgi:uncharacterized protein with HEPN domain